MEGTILTVIREASESAQTAAAAGGGLTEVFDAARDRGYDALERTPEMLAVLAEAGVVDAGGAGLLLLFDACLAEIDGRPMPEAPEPAAPPAAVSSAEVPAEESSIADLRYEVMFLLDAPDPSVDGFKAAWQEIGDSIVVVGGDGIWNCHIHTDDIGAAIEAGIAVGRPHRIQITDLLDQAAEHSESFEAPDRPVDDAGAEPAAAIEVTEADQCSVVAVGAGAGVVDILMSMGAHRVVAGGQSMNPSTAELLAAVDSLPTGHVVVLPNNKNIIPVAEQVDGETERTVGVVPTRSVVEGISSLMAFSPGATAAQNSEAMAAAAGAVTHGEVTQAVRDAASSAGPITEGDWLGIGPDGIAAVEGDVAAAATALLSSIIDDDHELLTVLTGTDADAATTDAIVGHVAEHHPDVEVEVTEGGQPLYPYYFGLE